VFAGEVMAQAEQFLEQNMHPTVIIKVSLWRKYFNHQFTGLSPGIGRHDCLDSGEIQAGFTLFLLKFYV
jgi:hypothetical protein